MGQVWEAVDTRLGRRVAVKTVRIGDGADPAVSERFHREAVATAALSHPGIVTVHDSGLDVGNPAGPTEFIVMEFLEGANLRDVLAEHGPLPLGTALRIGAAVASALAAAHQIGVVHRDIKPANILVDGPRVTVVDFGIAALTQSGEATLTHPGTTLGTASYIAPEQATGQPVDPAADVYSLGCVLYTLLTGHPPFQGEHQLALLHRHAHADPPRLTEALPGAPEAVEQLLLAMLVKEPGARPDAATVAQHLAHLAAGAPEAGAALATTPESPALPDTLVSPAAALPAVAVPTGVVPGVAVPPPPGSLPRRPTRRRRWVPFLAAAFALVAVVGLAYVMGLERGEEAATVAPATPSTSPPSETAASPTPSPAPTTTVAPPPTLPEALAGLRAVVEALPADVEDPDARGSLTDRLEALEAAADGPDSRLAQRLRDFIKGVDELEREGRLDPADVEALHQAVEDVAAAS